MYEHILVSNGLPTSRWSGHTVSARQLSQIKERSNLAAAHASESPRFDSVIMALNNALARLRKVKCDETWPVCQRCLSSGRTCDGYGIWGGGGNAHGQRYTISKACDKESAQDLSISHINGIPRQIQLASLDHDEQICVEWYMCRTATKLPGAFASKYWNSLLLQASSTDSAVMHAMLALSSAHQEVVFDPNCRPLRDTSHQELLTIRQYSKAIEYLQPHFSDRSRASICLTVITCMVFVTLEFLRGNYTIGMKHLQHGLNLLQEAARIVGLESGGSAQSTVCFDDQIVTLFTRILVQARLLGQSITSPHDPFLYNRSSLELRVFGSPDHARRTLEPLLLRIFDLEERRICRDEITTASRNSQQLVQNELLEWTQIYQTTMASLPDTTSPLEAFAYRLLELYQTIATIMADVCVDTNPEMAYARHTSDFVSIISHCIQSYSIVLQSKGLESTHAYDGGNPNANSISDIGWIPPLYYTAVKCRNHRVRLHAVRLLEAAPHKEGIWDAKLAAAVARKIIAVEEQRLYINCADDFDFLAAPTAQELLLLPVLPEAHMLHELKVALPDTPAGRLVLRCNRRESGLWEAMVWVYDLPSELWSHASGWSKCWSTCA